MPDRPACYGWIFPDLAQLEDNKPLKSPVFTVLLESSGMFVQRRSLQVDEAVWNACQQCQDYRSCYDLSLARFLLAQAIEHR